MFQHGHTIFEQNIALLKIICGKVMRKNSLVQPKIWSFSMNA
jgi:hypothetical protein